MTGEFVVGGELHSEEGFAPLLEPLVLRWNVQADFVVERHRPGFLALCGRHGIGEHFAGKHRLGRTPVNVANVYANALDGVCGSGWVVEIC